MSHKLQGHTSSCSDISGEQSGPRPPMRITSSASDSGSFVIQVPRDQIFRVPPPENAHRYKLYTRKARQGPARRRLCLCLTCRCFSLTLTILLLLFLAAVVAAGALYLAYRPKLPSFQVDALTFHGRNLSTPALMVLAGNPNSKLPILYQGGGSVAVLHYGAGVGKAAWPAFRLDPGEARGVKAVLAGVTPAAVGRMQRDARAGAVAVTVLITAPVRLRIGAVETKASTVTGTCAVWVDKVAPDGKVVRSTCDVKLKLRLWT